MSRWSRLKVALLTATVAVAALNWGGCLNLSWDRVIQYVTIANLFD